MQLNNISFGKKIFLLLLIPFVIIFYFLTAEISGKVTVIQEVTNFVTLTKLSVKVSSLVHEVQKERGLSNGYLGSRGKLFKEELLTQRNITDQKRQDLENFSTQFNTTLFSPSFDEAYKSIFSLMRSLKNHREKVMNLSVTSKTNFDYYTSLNASMLKVISHISDVNSNPEIATKVIGYENLLKGKEYLEMERALGVNALTQNKFEKNEYNEFVAAIAAQKIYFDAFERAATKQELELFIKQTKDPVITETIKLQSILIQRSNTGNFGIDSQTWFDVMTKRINMLKVVEDKQSADLLVRSKQIETEAQAELLLFIIFAIVVISCFLITFHIILSMTRQLKTLIKGVKIVTSGNLAFRIGRKGKDEISELALAFDNMTSQLQQVYKGLENRITQKTLELSEKVNDLEKSKIAMLNIMEDLEIDKRKIDEQKKILDSILDNLPVGVALFEAPSGKPIMGNKTGVEMLGRGLDPQAGKESLADVYQVYRSDGSPYPNAELPLSISLQSSLPISKDDLVLHRADNTKLSLRATSVPIKNAQGKVISIVTVFEDITHDKEVDRMKTEFISLASHQLRTPLSAIKWFSEMLLEGDAGELNSEQKDFTQNISQSTERMVQLVNSLLNISRIESGRILVDPHPTDLKELVQGVVTDLKAKIEERKQNLIISVKDDLPKVNLDPRLIRQVYMNLLTNAIKYTPKAGDITVLISKKGDEIISQVNDNGYGIPKSQQDRIFQKFFRAENVVKVETDGTGLGLYLIKAIVESSKGRIWFESEEGKGTTFWFSLPLSGMEAKHGEVTLD